MLLIPNNYPSHSVVVLCPRGSVIAKFKYLQSQFFKRSFDSDKYNTPDNDIKIMNPMYDNS